MINLSKPWLPLLLAFATGALGYLLVGSGPRGVEARTGDAQPWALPVLASPGLADAATTWAARAPWGQEASAQATGEVAVIVQPVGVVAVGGQWVALFAQSGGLVFRVAEGGSLPDGGQVTKVNTDRVEWVDAGGETQRRELLTGIVEAGPGQPAAATGRANRPVRADRSQRVQGPRASRQPGQAPARTPSPARERGQRRARTAVPVQDTPSRPPAGG